MPGALQLVRSIPSLSAALDRFLTRSRFAPHTRGSYEQDLAPLLARAGDQPVTGLTHETTVTFLAAQQRLAPAPSTDATLRCAVPALVPTAGLDRGGPACGSGAAPPTKKWAAGAGP